MKDIEKGYLSELTASVAIDLRNHSENELVETILVVATQQGPYVSVQHCSTLEASDEIFILEKHLAFLKAKYGRG